MPRHQAMAVVALCRAAALVLALPLATAAQTAAPRPADEWGDPLPDGAILRLGTIRLRHGGEVRGLAWLPDSKAVVSAGTEGVVRIWDAATGKELGGFGGHERGEEATTSGVKEVFALGNDRMASVGGDRALRIWNARTGVEERSTPIPFQWATCFSLSRDRTTLALAEWGRLESLDLASLELKLVCQLPTRLGSNPVCWSADGKNLFAADGETAITRLSREGTPAWTKALVGRCACVAASPDGRLVAVGEDRQGLRILRTEDGREILRVVAPELQAQILRFSPDSSSLVAGCWSAGLRIYRVEDGACIGAPGASRDTIWAVEFSPDGRLLATGSGAHRVRLWKWPTLKDAVPLPAHEGNLDSIAVSPDGTRIATASRGTLRLWDATTGKELGQPLAGQGGVRFVGFSLGKDTLVATAPEAVRAWNLSEQTETGRIELPASSAERMAFAAAAPVIAFTCYNWDDPSKSSMRVWNYRSGMEVCSLPVEAPFLNPIAISPDGSEMAYAQSWTIRLYALPEGKEGLSISLMPEDISFEEYVRDAESVQSLAYSNRGESLAVGTTKGRVLLCDPRTGEIRKQVQAHRRWVKALAFSPDDRALASSGWDDTVQVRETLTGAAIYDFSGQRGWGAALAWYPDGTRPVSGGADCVATVWDVSGEDHLAERKGILAPRALTGVARRRLPTRITAGPRAPRIS